ncbi:hypothetical protein DL764_002207 [Monosporascus ibericus]|uniref:Uncharacterized protein n=1 Tax=Monosporascus ibericus TaxID=155417 RepID=A0A4Q4TLD9_9PEZI|nr:hypothetical protein DL764_002207 [Monosporascus ibericus]
MFKTSRIGQPRVYQVRLMTTAVAQSQLRIPVRREGDISDSFISLSGTERPPLPPRFLDIKNALIAGHEQPVADSWKRLLDRLRTENQTIAREGPTIIPNIDFHELDRDLAKVGSEIRKRGVVVVRNVVPEKEARAYRDEIEEYVRQNPSTRAFPQNNPQVFELYWSPPQIRARAHRNLLKTQTALMRLWKSSNPESQISMSQPLMYADRLRIRQPGDANFALGPHIDGGSVERWEPHGYGRGRVYNKIFEGAWEEYDPWDASTRVPAITNNYDGLGACSMFRMFQGWLSMSQARPLEGTLMVNPLLQLSTAYLLLRPFFQPIKHVGQVSEDEYLSTGNWEYAGASMTSELQGATPGHSQELSSVLHPHLDLKKTMVHAPEIRPGDYVAWHCDNLSGLRAHGFEKLNPTAEDTTGAKRVMEVANSILGF